MCAHFASQLAFQRKVKNETCHRSDQCLGGRTPQETWADGGRNYLIERCGVCGRPRGVITPPHLREIASIAVRFDSLKEGGAQYQYPDALLPHEWAAIEAIQRAKSEDTDRNRPDTSEQAREAAAIAKLNQGRGVR